MNVINKIDLKNMIIGAMLDLLLKNTFWMKISLKLFDYYSSKGSNYDGYSTTEYKYKTFVKK